MMSGHVDDRPADYFVGDDARAQIQVRNAKIEDTYLGWDHGQLTAVLTVRHADGVQDTPHHSATKRPGYAVEFISAVLRMTGAACWRAVPGNYVMVKIRAGTIVAIGHLIESDRTWFDLREPRP